MSTYANVLTIAIPIFFFLVLLEILYGLISKKYYYSFMDTLSSLSSGITNLLKDLLGIGIIIISYPFIKKSISIIDLNESIVLYIIAFFFDCDVCGASKYHRCAEPNECIRHLVKHHVTENCSPDQPHKVQWHYRLCI